MMKYTLQLVMNFLSVCSREVKSFCFQKLFSGKDNFTWDILWKVSMIEAKAMVTEADKQKQNPKIICHTSMKELTFTICL